MTNTKGQPFYDLLRKAGLPVQGVVALGVFVHVECQCDGTARKAAHLMSKGGFTALKITHGIRRKPGWGSPPVEYWTAHFKVTD